MSTYGRRLDELMRLYLGSQICDKLAELTTEEVYINPDMQVRYIDATCGRRKMPHVLKAGSVEAFLRTLATLCHQDISEQRPALAVSLAQGSLGKCRIQGFLPPLTPGPALIIRKPCPRVPTLAEYVAQGILCSEGLIIIEQSLKQRFNILVAGPTASGKTTLCNALLLAIAERFPDDRLVLLEDTAELRVTSKDCLQMQTTDTVSMRQLVKYSLRATPNRIVVGEVRDGSAKDLLDAWITGHPGGCGTVHGETAALALERLADLARDGSAGTDQRHLVLRAIQVVVLITGFGRGRIVKEIARPTDLMSNGFALDYLLRR
ncbi:MAG: ATPase, T2SS/T4P/T4SS family [Bacteroidota bacterium]|nr:ATPase, T2SS/T4P/T4SS family [Bacteroidota bacterium]